MENRVNKAEFKVSNIKKETNDVVTISLSPINERFEYKAGQYIAIYLDKDKNSQAKFYTMSNTSSEESVDVSVKKMGSFSGALHDLKAGDAVYLSGPYGRFYPKEEADNLVFLAAGIGVTPFLSIIKDCKNKDIKKQINLFYTNKTFEDTAFYKDINKIAEKVKTLKVHYCLTRDKLKYKSITRYERINAEYLKEKLNSLVDNNFYICGPISFVSDFRKRLLEEGVNEENIFTESFY